MRAPPKPDATRPSQPVRLLNVAACPLFGQPSPPKPYAAQPAKPQPPNKKRRAVPLLRQQACGKKLRLKGRRP